VLLAVCLGNALSMFNTTMVSVVLPDLQRDLEASPTALQWVSTSYTLAYASMLLPAGALGNRIGRRATFLLGIGIFVVASLACVAAPSPELLIAARVAQGLGCAILLPQTLTIIVDEFADAAGRARAIAMWSGLGSLGLVAGPVLGGLLVGLAGWRWGFAFSTVLGLVVLFIAHRTVPRERHGRIPGAPPVDLAGAITAVVALLALVYGLIESRNLGWTSPVIPGSLAIAGVAIVAFLRLEHVLGRRGRHPLMPLGLWRNRAFVAASAAGLVYFFMFFGVLFFLSLALQHGGFSPLLTGVAFIPMLGAQSVVGLLSGRVVARFGPARVLVVGLAIAVVGTALLALLPASPTFADVEWRLAVVGIGSGLMSAPMSNLAVTSVDRAHSGTASATHTTFRQIGATLAIATLGLIPAADRFGRGSETAMAVVAVLLGVGAIVVAVLGVPRARPSVAVPALDDPVPGP
jgi:EmrB/QacA subfamily drug resistance transporter